MATRRHATRQIVCLAVKQYLSCFLANIAGYLYCETPPSRQNPPLTSTWRRGCGGAPGVVEHVEGVPLPGILLGGYRVP